MSHVPRHDLGQATAEYALVLIGAAVGRPRDDEERDDGGGAGRIGELFDLVLGNVIDRAATVE